MKLNISSKKEKFSHASPLPQGWLPAVSSWSPPRLKVPPIWRNLPGRRRRTPPPPAPPLPKLRSSKVLESLSPTQTQATGYWFHISLSRPLHNSRWFDNSKDAEWNMQYSGRRALIPWTLSWSSLDFTRAQRTSAPSTSRFFLKN